MDLILALRVTKGLMYYIRRGCNGAYHGFKYCHVYINTDYFATRHNCVGGALRNVTLLHKDEPDHDVDLPAEVRREALNLPEKI